MSILKEEYKNCKFCLGPLSEKEKENPFHKLCLEKMEEFNSNLNTNNFDIIMNQFFEENEDLLIANAIRALYEEFENENHKLSKYIIGFLLYFLFQFIIMIYILNLIKI